MIASVRGTVTVLQQQQVVLDVQGIGYAVQITPRLSASLRHGETVSLHTALVVREDAMSLFGFADPQELAVFDLLIGVSGVGPRSALAILGTLTVDEIARAIAAEDDAPFRKVSGIGPKTAKLIIVSLAGKLVAAADDQGAALPQAAAATQLAEQVLVALVGLGWPERVAAAALDDVLAEQAPQTVAEALRLTLTALGRPGVTR